MMSALVFSPSFFMNVKLAYYGTGFSLTPAGDTSGSVDFDKQVTTYNLHRQSQREDTQRRCRR